MDFDLDSFFEVENIISAIFNGGPLFPDPGGAQILPATRTTQSSQDTTVTPTFTPTPVASYAPTYSLGKITTSPSSLSPQSGDDAPKQVRSKDDAPRPEIVEKTPSVYTDSLGQLFLAPDLDMSTAITLSKRLQKGGKRSHDTAFGDDDNSAQVPRHVSIDEACQLPEKKLRDDLVKLYFTHFHPLCPVVDEVEFMEIYRDTEDDEQLKQRFSLPLFQGMMNVAFGHLPSARLPSTPYKSIYEGQRSFFDKASLLYRVRYTSDHLVLVKLALLLTYWSPFDSEYQVNNYWTDRAFFHARCFRLWDRQGESVATSRRYRIIWWCCLLRDRLISIALRRPYRIHEAKKTWPIVSESDFGREVMFPRFMTVKAKRTTIDSFIWLCKLSDIMRDIAVFQEKKRFDREWSNALLNSAAIIPEASQVSQFESRLKNWKEEYVKVNGDYIRTLRPGTSKMPNYVLIICDSVLATLWMPYIHCPPGSGQVVQRFQKAAIQRINKASSAVALHCRKLSQATKVGEEFIVGIIAWIALPMAVFKVFEENGAVPNELNDRSYEDFVPFLSALAMRFRPAKLLVDIMCEETSEIVERSTKLGISQKDVQDRLHDLYRKRSSNVVDRSKTDGEANRSKDAEEAEILNCVAKMIDLRFSTDGST